jgi:positive phototaxis protein PixI
VKSKTTPNQFLIFDLTPNLQGMISTVYLNEVMTCDLSQVLPIFDVPPSVMGICNNRSEILWMVDLPCLLELPPLYAKMGQSCNTMIVHQEGQVVGFVVLNIGQLIQCNIANIQAAPLQSLPRRLGKCVDGLYRLPQGKDMLVLNGPKLFDLLKINAPQDL